MQFKTFILPFLSLLMACYSLPSHAFKVDKMIVVGDQKGNGIITLTNDQNVPLLLILNLMKLLTLRMELR